MVRVTCLTSPSAMEDVHVYRLYTCAMYMDLTVHSCSTMPLLWLAFTTTFTKSMMPCCSSSKNSLLNFNVMIFCPSFSWKTSNSEPRGRAGAAIMAMPQGCECWEWRGKFSGSLVIMSAGVCDWLEVMNACRRYMRDRLQSSRMWRVGVLEKKAVFDKNLWASNRALELAVVLICVYGGALTYAIYVLNQPMRSRSLRNFLFDLQRWFGR